MITDTIHNLIHYRGIHPNLDTVVDWLQQNDITTLSLGKTVIDGNNVYVNVMETNLRKADSAEFEFHRLYADLQIDIDGAEYWEWSSADTAGSDFDVENDVGFIAAPAHADGTLGEARFALFFPGEPHKPSCQTDRCVHLRKAVFKIKIK